MPLKKKKIIKKVISVKKKPLTKKPSRNAVRKPIRPKPRAHPQEVILGRISHFYARINVAVVKLKALLKTGDNIRIQGHTTNLEETVSSMQLNHQAVNEASKGKEIGLWVSCRVRAGDTIYKV